MAGRQWFPASLEGRTIVLRRHVPDNLGAFRRWYRDPEVARLARYQDGPMSIEEIDRFFQARAIGGESMAMAIHVRGSNRLIGTCALSQLDADNGSALYHITIGEKDAWGHGYGTEATGLMLDHALGTLGLHRIALSVFEFNERAIRAYLACGLEIEGRAREAIWRDGRWWDELSMSILESEWRRRRRAASEAATAEAAAATQPLDGDGATRRGIAARILGR
ncbi:MAG: GNAT family N-acetyltransferase [Chloroflexi bacterium]|nr:GNAT family N-acetyltransferase [Chloroflexota bacterium]